MKNVVGCLLALKGPVFTTHTHDTSYLYFWTHGQLTRVLIEESSGLSLLLVVWRIRKII